MGAKGETVIGAGCGYGTGCDVVDPTTNGRWDSLLEDQPERTLFHSSAWASVLKDTYGHKPMYFMNSSVTGSSWLWPVMEVSSPLTGKRGVSLPFADMCAPIMGSSEELNEQLKTICGIGRERGWRYFEFRGGSTGSGTPSVSFCSHIIELHKDSDLMLRRCESSVRRALRKAQQHGLRVEVSHTWEAVRTFFDLHCRTRRKHGLPPQSLSFFRNIHRHVIASDRGFIVTVYQNDRAIAAGMFFHSGDQAIYKFGASDERLLELRANNLMLWSGMQHSATLNCKSLHLGRTDKTNEGLRRFKLGWGSQEGVLNYFRIDLQTGTYLQASNLGTGWHNSVFRRMPILLLRAVGTALYRHMA